MADAAPPADPRPAGLDDLPLLAPQDLATIVAVDCEVKYRGGHVVVVRVQGGALRKLTWGQLYDQPVKRRVVENSVLDAVPYLEYDAITGDVSFDVELVAEYAGEQLFVVTVANGGRRKIRRKALLRFRPFAISSSSFGALCRDPQADEKYGISQDDVDAFMHPQCFLHPPRPSVMNHVVFDAGMPCLRADWES